MPANRSRTLDWRRCLQQVFDRNGALEIAVATSQEPNGEDSRHLVWRVRIVDLTKQEILVEQPTTLGQAIDVKPGIELVAMLAVGQNRWMFSTTSLGPISHQLRGQRTITALRLVMPKSVERCQRRHYYRMETAGLNLPSVTMWPLLNAKSVLLAERANELQIQQDGPTGDENAPSSEFDDAMALPEVGPKFIATLLNIGGGGVGLRVVPTDAHVLSRHKLFWLRFSLPPKKSTPVCATGKLVHTHVDSTQHTYAGMAFDFSFNPVHQRFVVEQICRYIALQQEAQFGQQGDASQRRRSA